VKPWNSLAIRIYLVGLVQIVVLAAGFVVFSPRPPFRAIVEREADYVAKDLAASLDDPARLAARLARVRDDLHGEISLYAADHTLLAASDPGRPIACAESFAMPDMIPCVVVDVALADGSAGRAVFLSRMWPPPPGRALAAFILVVVGISALILARAVTRPLAQISSAARAFGAGRLDARAALTRGDELGQVATAFDQMADQIVGLLRAEMELLANVSHELRTPLANIRVALDLAVDGDAAMARASLGEIFEDLDELERLVSDILTAARLDLGGGQSSGGAPPLRRVQLEPADVVTRAAARFHALHPERALHVEIEADLPALEGDPILLRRAVDNLLENAHRYSDVTAPIDLVATGTADEVRLLVRDRGIGIAPEDLPRIFEPFFRADRSRTRATGGLGLGLALARRIAQAHGGSIEITSAVGEGARAMIRVPTGAARNVESSARPIV
jgi:signal transduction histidine kinase